MTTLGATTRSPMAGILRGGPWAVLQRRGALLVSVCVLVTVGGYLRAQFAGPVYRSSGRFLVRESSLQSPLVDSYALRIDAEAQLDLLAKASHAPDLLAATVASLPDSAAIPGPPPGLANQLELDVGADNVVSVAATATSADLAQALAAAYLEACTQCINQPRLEAARAIREFIAQELDRARETLDRAHLALSDYRAAHGKVLPELEAITYNLLLSLEAEQVELDSRRHALAEERTLLESEPAVSGQTVDGLRTQIAQVERDLTAAAGRLTEQHPDLQTMRARLARLQIDLSRREQGLTPPADPDQESAAMQRYRAVVIEQQALDRRAEQVATRVQELQAKIAAASNHDAEFVRRLRDVESHTEIYLDLIRRRERAATSEHLARVHQGDVVQILATPRRPDRPEAPPPISTLVLSAAIGLVAGLSLAAVAELTDQRIRDQHDLAQALDAPTLATIGQPRRKG